MDNPTGIIGTDENRSTVFSNVRRQTNLPGLIGSFGIPSPSDTSKQSTSPSPGLSPSPFSYQTFNNHGNNNIIFPAEPLFPSFCQLSYTTNPEEVIKGSGNHQQHSEAEVFSKLPSRYPRLDKNLRCVESYERMPTSSAGVIEPIIENLMGSIGNSDGTYSHFGPTNSGLPFVQGYQENVLSRQASPLFAPKAFGADHLINTDPFNSTPEWEFQRKMESIIRQKQLEKQQLSSPVPFSENKATNIAAHSHGSGILSNSSAKVAKPIPPTRPDPLKPSYLEMLTKNCPKDRTTDSSIPKKPGDASDTMKGDSSNFQFPSQVHRKSWEGTSLVGSSSSPASNSSTASSSPVAKLRTQQKGKENLNGNPSVNSSSSSKSSSRKDTPVVTPVHQRVPLEDLPKKSQIPGSTCWITKLSGKTTTGKGGDKRRSDNASMTGKGSSQSNFDDFGVANDEDETPKQQHVACNTEDKQGGGSIPKKKTKRKFSSSGGDTIEIQYVNNGSDRRTSPNEAKGGNANSRKGNPGKSRGKKDGRNCAVQKFRAFSEQWITHLMKAITWLWMLLMNVTVLSASLGYKLMEDLLAWWKMTALLTFHKKWKLAQQKFKSGWKRVTNWGRKKQQTTTPKPGTYDEFLSVLGPDQNITLPSTGDDALKRLISVKGQDPYSILGVRSNSCEETIRRYYKKQAVLVHPDKNLTPGAEEAFKILAKAFEMVGEPEHRLKYHQQLLEAHAKERFIGEFGELFEELRKKMETVCSTIRCTKCKGRHKKNKTTRPVFAARYCSQCKIHHAAREGELWVEKVGMFSFTWHFYTCMSNQIWEINEWGRCQRSSLNHLKPNSHNVIYRLVSNGQPGGKGRSCSGGNSSGSGGPPLEDDLLDPEMEDWDSLFNNLYRNSGNATNHFPNATTHQGCSKGAGNGNYCQESAGVAGKKRKGKKK